MGIVRWIKDALGQSGEDPTTETETSRKFPQQDNLCDNINWLVRHDLERLQDGLEKIIGEPLVIGFRRHEDFPSEGGPRRPVHYRAEFSRAGYYIFYLARANADHTNGPIVETEDRREATWIICANAAGRNVEMELFDLDLEQDIVNILNEKAMEGSMHVVKITVHEVCAKRRYAMDMVKGSVSMSKHVLYPRPLRTVYRNAAKAE